MGAFTYFAYGSNMLTRRLRERTPSARPLAPAILTHHALGFSKLGRDGSGKCHVRPTGQPHDRVHGILFSIAWADRPALDAAEPGYHATQITVCAGGRDMHDVLAYVSDVVETGLAPFDWYKAIVIAGAAEHGLPQAYVDWLRTVPARPDPDPERSRHHHGLLLPLD